MNTRVTPELIERHIPPMFLDGSLGAVKWVKYGTDDYRGLPHILVLAFEGEFDVHYLYERRELRRVGRGSVWETIGGEHLRAPTVMDLIARIKLGPIKLGPVSETTRRERLIPSRCHGGGLFPNSLAW